MVVDSKVVGDGALKLVETWAVSERITECKQGRRLANRVKEHVSIKEKLAKMKEKAYDQKLSENFDIAKSRRKEESL